MLAPAAPSQPLWILLSQDRARMTLALVQRAGWLRFYEYSLSRCTAPALPAAEYGSSRSSLQTERQ